MAINAESENKIAQLTEEIQGLVRNIKARDKNIQESDVKIEMMNRRMEAVKRQADTIADLEGELVKARQQEREYEEAMEHFQTEVYTLEQENNRLKGLISTQEKPGKEVVDLSTIIPLIRHLQPPVPSLSNKRVLWWRITSKPHI